MTTKPAIEALAAMILDNVDNPNFRGRLEGRIVELAQNIAGGDHTDQTEFQDLLDNVLNELDQEDEDGYQAS